MLKLHTVSTQREFRTLQAKWETLAQRSVDNHVFLTWEWQSIWWKHFASSHRELRVLLVIRDQEVIAIAPFMLSRYPFISLGQITAVEFIGSPDSDYQSFLLASTDTEYGKICIEYLLSQYSDWDLLKLTNIPELSLTGTILQVHNKSDMLQQQTVTKCPYVSLPRSAATYWRQLSRKMRSNLNRSLNALKRHHQIQFTTHEAFASLAQAMEAFMSLHQQRRHAKGEIGLFTNKAHRNFHQDLAQIFANNHWLRLHFLFVDNTPVAANYCFAYRSTMYNYQSGFDPAFTKFGVGHLLTLHSINEAIREGMTRFDFTIGDEAYKHRWTTQFTRNIELHYRRQGISSRIYQWGSTSPIIRRISRKLGLTDPTHHSTQHSARASLNTTAI